MQNINTAKLSRLAFDFQNALSAFSSTKAERKQRQWDESNSTKNAQPAALNVSEDKERLFAEIKDLLEDF